MYRNEDCSGNVRFYILLNLKINVFFPIKMYYKKFKREENPSTCNICLKIEKLSWDHVPPKGGINLFDIKHETILEKLTVAEQDKKYSYSQNGVKYRTICENCNNNLGRNYDIELNRFSLDVKNIIEKQLKLPSTKYFKVKPNKIIKSIYGHLLASKIDIENTKIDESLRAYFFDKKGDVKVNLKLFYWLYPFANIVIIRDISMPAIRGATNEFGLFSILKYYPIAFLLTNLDNYYNLDELTKYASDNIEDEIDIPINLQLIKNYDWPESVNNGNMIIGGQSIKSSVFATPRK
ncbi:MAG TPA: hypothetical protein PLH80_04805 [Spirochaetota bacterium]|jgi:hypothetical protein|nr:hypothetical protein [Spirochaetota bacterium]HQK07385.1 hypothetical protein [Spirochaetota bacterium]